MIKNEKKNRGKLQFFIFWKIVIFLDFFSIYLNIIFLIFLIYFIIFYHYSSIPPLEAKMIKTIIKK